MASSAKQVAPLLLLPWAIKEQIYHHLFTNTVLVVEAKFDSSPRDPKQPSDEARITNPLQQRQTIIPIPSILLACKQTLQEARHLYHSRVTYVFPSAFAFSDAMATWSPKTITAIREVHFRLRNILRSSNEPTKDTVPIHISDLAPPCFRPEVLHLYYETPPAIFEADNLDMRKKWVSRVLIKMTSFLWARLSKLLVVHVTCANAPPSLAELRRRMIESCDDEVLAGSWIAPVGGYRSSFRRIELQMQSQSSLPDVLPCFAYHESVDEEELEDSEWPQDVVLVAQQAVHRGEHDHDSLLFLALSREHLTLQQARMNGSIYRWDDLDSYVGASYDLINNY